MVQGNDVASISENCTGNARLPQKGFSEKMLSVRLCDHESKVVPPQPAEKETWGEFAISSLKNKEKYFW